MGASFDFKRFRVCNDLSAFPVGTDAVLLGASLTIGTGERDFLDVGCGTGVISLIAAQRLEGRDFKLTGIDSDELSARQAALNFEVSPWKDRLSALSTRLQDFGGSFDHIFSNPPYFDESLKNPDSRKSSARHTEDLSYREICAFASTHLRTEGTLSMVLPADCERQLLRITASFGLFPFRLLRVSGTASKKPSRLVAEFSRSRRGVQEEREVLQDGTSRSRWYSDLTADFYLK